MPLLFAWGAHELRPGDEALVPAAATVIVVPDEDHVGAFRRTDVLLPHLRALLGTVRPAVATAGR